MGTLAVCGKTSDMWEVPPYIGSFRKTKGKHQGYGEYSYTWEDLPIHPRVCEDFPCMEMSSRIRHDFP